MAKRDNTRELLERIEFLEADLAEAREVLQAIQAGEIDALVVSTPEGEQIYSLKGAEHAYRLMVEAMSEGAVTLDASGTIIYCNQRFADMVRAPLEKVIGASMDAFVQVGERLKFRCLLEDARRGGGRLETTLLPREGGPVPVLLSASSLSFDEQSAALCLIVADLTEQKRTEEILASAELVRTVFEQTNEGLVVCDADGIIIRANSGAEQLAGRGLYLRPFDKSFRLSYAKDENRRFKISDVLQGKDFRDLECIKEDQESGNRFVLVSAGPLRREKQIIGGFVFLIDITARKQLEEDLSQSEARYRLLAATAGQLLETDDPQTMVDGLCRDVMAHLDCHVFFNFMVDERSGRLRLNACAGISENDAPMLQWLDKGVAICGCVALEKQRIIAEDILNSEDTRTDLVKSFGVQAYCCHPLMIQEELLGTLSFGTKTRPHFTPEEVELMRVVANQVAIAMQRQRMAKSLQERTAQYQAANKDLESFTYSVSHDLRAPLRAIDGFSKMLLRDAGTQIDEESRRKLTVVRESTEKMNRLIDDLLDLSRLGRQALALSHIDMKKLFHEAWEELCELAPERAASLKVDELDDALGDRSLLKQVVLNLLSNALKFTRDREPAVIEIASAKDDDFVKFSVKDNGAGFDMKYRDKLFGVFQRLHSKSEYEGTGVGLAIVQRIINRHGGRVWAEGKVGKGATFYFSLPITGISEPGM